LKDLQAAETLRQHLPATTSHEQRIADWWRRSSADMSERGQLRQLGFVDDGVSWVRPANASLLASLAPQAVPRRVLQMGLTFTRAANKHVRYMHGWWALNPEYEYRFFTDAQCGTYVQRHASDDEWLAYTVVAAGQQRSDLFRGLWLRREGGIYADLDCELGLPLRLRVPSGATLVANPTWAFEFLMSAPAHPIIEAFVKIAVGNVLAEARKLRDGAKDRCRGPHQCVIRITGPLAWSSAVGVVTGGGDTPACRNGKRRARTPMPGECDAAPDALMRGVHVCGDDLWTTRGRTVMEGGEPAWMCSAIRHWDCRVFVAGGCSKSSYRNGGLQPFFNASLLDSVRPGRV